MKPRVLGIVALSILVAVSSSRQGDAFSLASASFHASSSSVRPVPLPASSREGERDGTPVVEAGTDLEGAYRRARTEMGGEAGGPAREEIPVEALTEVVQGLCATCHNEALMTGNLSLEEFEVAEAAERAPVAEKMIVKLRAAMMPPPGVRKPEGDTLLALVEELEERIDSAAAEAPEPGGRTFQRLNRSEYEAAVEELLDLEVDAGDYLPLDEKSANFDNIADVQLLSPTLMDAYLRAASEISRLAVGDPDAGPGSVTYNVPRLASQDERVEGAPRGTRGGVSVEHTFPADGEYRLELSFYHETTGDLFGNGRSALHTHEYPEQVEISVDGERVALLDVDRWMHVSDPDGVTLETDPIFIRAGARRLTAAFLRRFEGPTPDLISPHEWTLASTSIADAYGFAALPHLWNLEVRGPYRATGVSETPSRRAIFTCRPVGEEERACAESIVERLASEAYRRPITDRDREALLGFYEEGAAEGGFEEGVRMALQAILASPHFLFRMEPLAEEVAEGGVYRISDLALASRLSFFLWGRPPDEGLLERAGAGELSDPEVLEAEALRMLEDPRAEALATRFAAQWLRLQDLEKVHPDRLLFPDFHEQLAEAMRRETELFFYSIVREDRSVLDLYSADYTYVNERLARHYGIPGVVGEEFRRVEYSGERRRGLFGHGSILTLTSVAGRTSPVLRGKWVMEVLLGTPPPPPPPGVPDLDETEGTKDGRFLTTRERMEMHRANPVCASCHNFMDPIGLALDNYDVTGRWRIRENGMPLDTRGELWDGTPVSTPGELREALLERPTPLLRTFTTNLMAYALGRRVEYYDQPTVRRIVAEAAEENYRFSAFVKGIVESDAFRLRRVGEQLAAEVEEGTESQEEREEQPEER